MSDLLSGRRVLIVEDEMVILLMIEGILEDLGCRSVTSTSTVSGAISAIASEVFDVAMLDVNLGGEDSDAVADALSQRSIPFFYCTGNCRRDMREGFCDRTVLHKPFREADLSAALMQLLE